MAYETVKDILDRVRKFHHQVSEYYHQLCSIADKERVKLLLDYMSRRENQLEDCLLEYEKDAPEEILNTWFKYTPDSTYQDYFEENDMNHDMSIDDVITVALHLDDYLISALKIISENAESVKIKEMFSSLISLEEQEKRKLVTDSLELMEY